jgi:hypothetical protein
MKRMFVLFAALALALAVPFLFYGCGSGSDGVAGTSAPTSGTIAGAVTDSVKLDALSGVTVTAKDSGGAVLATATTDATGSYSMVNVPLGTVNVYFSKTYYTAPGGMTVGVLGGRTVTINAAMAEASSGAPSVSITGYNNGMYTTDDFGYGGTSALAASGNDPNGDNVTYAWSNGTAPVLGAVTGAGTSGTVTFPTIAEAFASRADTVNLATISGYTIPDRFGILPVIPDTRGTVTSKVTVSDGRGKTASVSLSLNAASVLTSARNVAIGTRVYMNRGNDNASQTWTLTPPGGSAAVLDNASSRTPSFVADLAGSYALSAGGNSITIFAGNWVGVITGGTGDTIVADGACTGCHNDVTADDMFTAWATTKHATIMTVGINGGSGSSSISCLTCHSVGFDRGTANNGFDDLAVSTGWVFPTSRVAGNWDSMLANFPTVARMANIQCENCHGPQNSAAHGSTGPFGSTNTFASDRISYSAELCATCHASGAGHNIYSQWATPNATDNTGHSNRSRAIASGTSSHCGRCHSAQGYTIYLDQLAGGNIGNIASSTWSSVTTANVEPVTCTACHDPHDASNPNQLRVYGDTGLLPSGFQMTGVGKGAICITCHNSRNGGLTSTTTFLHEDGAINPTGYSAPHQACQGDVFAGRNAYFLGTGSLPLISRHAAVEDTCVGCHMALNPKTHLSHGSLAVNSHLFRIDAADIGTLCSNCHGTGTVNGEGIQSSIEAGLASIASKIGTAATTKINGVAGGIIRVRAYDSATGLYSSTSSSNSNVSINVATNPVVSVGIEEGHGQIEFHITLTSPITITWTDGSTTTTNQFGVQLGSLKDNQGTPAVLYALSGNMVRAGWNYFLIEGDQSLGIHNPIFAQQVLNSTLAQDLSN